MKRLALLFFFPSLLPALYQGNPAEPELIDKGFFISQDSFFSFKLGYEGDFVSDRMLEAHEGATGRMDSFNFHVNQGVFSLNMMDGIEVYGTLGSMNAYIAHHPGFDNIRREYQTKDHLAWGTGGRVIFFRAGDYVLGCSGGYFSSASPVEWDALDGVSFPTTAKFHYHEWQIGVGLSLQIDFLVPYAAIKYSHVKSEINHLQGFFLPHTSFKMKSREHWGATLGVTITKGKYFDLTAEVQLFDEQAATVSGMLKF